MQKNIKTMIISVLGIITKNGINKFSAYRKFGSIRYYGKKKRPILGLITTGNKVFHTSYDTPCPISAIKIRESYIRYIWGRFSGKTVPPVQ